LCISGIELHLEKGERWDGSGGEVGQHEVREADDGHDGVFLNLGPIQRIELIGGFRLVVRDENPWEEEPFRRC
jgi:hypothetical protein